MLRVRQQECVDQSIRPKQILHVDRMGDPSVVHCTSSMGRGHHLRSVKQEVKQLLCCGAICNFIGERNELNHNVMHKFQLNHILLTLA